VEEKCVNGVPNDAVPRRSGWVDTGHLNDWLFCTITDFCGNIEVVGKIISMSTSQSSQWTTKMEQDNIDDKLPWTAILQTGGLGQIVSSDLVEAFKGRTHYTKSQTRLVWTGTAPIDIQLEVEFLAIKDPDLEVGTPIQWLRKMVAPELKESLIDSYKDIISSTISGISAGVKPDIGELDNILGYVPHPITLSIFDYVFATEYYMTSIDVSDSEMLIIKDGHSIKQVASMSFMSVDALNKTDILPYSASSMMSSDGIEF